MELVKAINSKEKQIDEGSESIKMFVVKWDTNSDVLEFEINSSADKFVHLQATKTNVLSAISQIFHPLGMLIPIFITAKMLIQRIHISVKE